MAAKKKKSKKDGKPVVAVEVTTVHGPASELGYVQNFYADGKRVYAAGGGWEAVLNESLLLRSDDDGATFEQIVPPTDTGLRDVYAEGETILVVGDHNCIARSEDGGKTWKALRKASDWGDILYTIIRDQDGVFWVVGDGGLLYKSVNGKTFRKVTVPMKQRLLRFYPDPQNAKKPWLLGEDGIFRLTGKTWKKVSLRKKGTANDALPTMCEIVRTTTGTLIIVGDGGSIFWSVDDGKTWERATCPAGAVDLEAVIVTTFGILAVGDEGTLIASNDDGRTWVNVETSTKMEGHVWSVIAAGDGLLIGSNSAGIYRLSTSDLAKILIAAFQKTDTILAKLAEQIRDGQDDETAQLVLEDALRERSLL
jgi:photosystem II stability/assembly factor-like uncharacterized protein